MLNATPLLALYAKKRLKKLAHLDPVLMQEFQLLKLVSHAQATRFGRDHDFAGITDVAKYQAHVKLRRYEDFWRDYWQPAFPVMKNITWPGKIPYFAASSGTTSGNTKFISVTKQMMASNRKAALDLLSFHFAARPDTKIMGGKNFLLGGNADLMAQADGVYSGDLSGIAASALPWWTKGRYFPDEASARIADWEEKVDRLAPLSLTQDIRMLGGTVSWVLAFIERAMALKPGANGIADIYSTLELLVHGGVNFGPYKRRFDALLADSKAETREVYPASEGFIGVADRGPGEGLRLMLDNGIFYEFIPVEELETENPTRHWIKNVETGQNYAIALTTNAGLWSYLLGDTVRFVDTEAPRVLVTGRTSYFLSAFGEHLIGEEIESSVELAAAAIGAMINDYSVGALYPENTGEKGRHLFIVEFVPPQDESALARFAAVLDAALAETNLDYREHRAHDLQMLPPLVQQVAPGTFAAWMKSRGKLGAQNKVPRVITDEELFLSLREAAN